MTTALVAAVIIEPCTGRFGHSMLRRPLNNPLQTPLGHVAMFGSMAGNGYWWWSYAGPFRWLAELQMLWFGAYEPLITFLIGAIGCGLIAVVLLWTLARFGLMGEVWRMTREEAHERGQEWVTFMQMHDRLFKGSSLAVTGLVFGSVLFYHAQLERQMTVISAVELESGMVPVSNWIELTGIPRPEYLLEYQSMTDQFCIPIVSSGWTQGQHAAVVIHGNRRDKDQVFRPATGAIQGVITIRAVKRINGLPGPVRVEYERAGIIGNNVLALTLEHDPQEFRTLSIILLSIGSILAIAMMIAWLTVWRTHRTVAFQARDDS